MIRPQNALGFDIEQFDRDASALSPSAKAAAEEIAHPQTSTDVARIACVEAKMKR